MRAYVLFLAVAACGGGSTPQPIARSEPAKATKFDAPPVEPAQAEPTKVEPTEVEPAKVDDGKAEPAAVDPDAPEPPRPDLRASVFFREAPQPGRATVWQASKADPTVPEQLPFVVDYEPGGAVGIGTTTPLLSQNGAWLAYLDRGHLTVGMLDGSMKERVTRHGPAQVSVLISGFSPDSATLLFEQHEVQSEEGLPLPADVAPGFTLLTLAGFAGKHLPALPAFEAWSPGSTRVVFERREGGGTELVTYEVESGKLAVQQRVPTNFGFSQLVVGAEHVVYVRVPKEGRSQVVRAKLDGSALVELSPEGEFAQYQWPRIAVDGKQVAYRDGTRVVRVGIDGGTASEVTVCKSSDCEHAWESGTGLLVLDAGTLVRHEGGTQTTVATDVLGFAVAGDPG